SAAEGLKKKLPEPVSVQSHQTASAQVSSDISAQNTPISTPAAPVELPTNGHPIVADKHLTEKTEQKNAAPNVPPKVKKGGWGAAASAIIPSLPDLNTIYENNSVAKEGDEPELIRGTEQREVTFSQFISLWNMYAEQLKAENKINLYTLMTATQPRLQGTLIEVDVENAVQMDVLQSAKIDV